MLNKHPFREMILQKDNDINSCIISLVQAYNNHIDINNEDYLESIGFFNFPLSEQTFIIKEVNKRI